MSSQLTHLFRLVLVAGLVASGCSPKSVTPGDTENHGCKEPPPDTFTSVGVDAHFTQSTFWKIVMGDVGVKVTPSVVSLASNAARSALVRDYLRCLAMNRDHFSKAQVIYVDSVNAFLETQPSAEAFMQWHQMNPFPARSDEQMKVLEGEVDKLREQVTRSDQELHTLQARVKERSLTASQRRSFIETLSKVEKGEINVDFPSGNSEAEHFAHDIALALQESGWKVANMGSIVFLGGTPIGLLAVVKDPRIPSVQTLLSALLQIDPKLQLKINPNLDKPIVLNVGSKP